MKKGAAYSLLLALVLCSGFSVQAKFYTKKNLPIKPDGFSRLLGAAVYLKGIEGGTCSGAVVSNSGYVITNVHCIRHCLEDLKLISPYNKQEAKKNGWGLYKTVTSAPANAFCRDLSISIPDDEKIVKTIGWNAQVVYLGRSWGFIKNLLLDKIDQEVHDEFAKHLDDFAILKFKLDPEENANCLLLGRSPHSAETLWVAGFPRRTSRKDGFDSRGPAETTYISVGQIRTEIRDDVYLQSLGLSERAWQKIDFLSGLPRFLRMNIDTISGMSGAPIVNARGELVGINYSTYAPSAVKSKKDVNSTSMAMRAQYIYDQVRRSLGIEKTQEIFDCR